MGWTSDGRSSGSIAKGQKRLWDSTGIMLGRPGMPDFQAGGATIFREQLCWLGSPDVWDDASVACARQSSTEPMLVLGTILLDRPKARPL
jgi:hypothetical protein